MRSSVDIILDITNQAYHEALNILATHHTPKDLLKYIKDVGVETELFLRESIYHNRNNRDNFKLLIDNLSRFNVSTTSIISLNELRREYNKAKHDPTTTIQSLDVIKIIKNTYNALKEIKDLNLGSNMKTQSYSRVVWIAGWDHFNSGDTEIQIMIPYDGNKFPPHIDFFNIHWEGWDKLIERFKVNNTLLMGKEYFPDNVYNMLQNTGDFIGAGIYNGDYRELILEISKYVDSSIEEELIPDLQRKNAPIAIFYAIIYSTCDVISEGRFVHDIEVLKETILSIATYKYAILGESLYTNEWIPIMAEILMNLKEEHRNHLEGPIFLSSDKFESMRKESYITKKSPNIQITNDGKLLVLLV
ncbi:hypothetical protein RRU94_15905 [Domibacillus sp. DTU_2020_1001157_1_SI_ALB_TIR_016]|uniref:hypothetical protein n=1 Tax=Domibacillus sp. DTU_2020_1001157_1_SI_ALB_TIR_016 TaxID=3077789 RepID=UPI0028E9BF1B|nr:hypothetical protein [Domibacillus sp. DTU_2020_1001157_1_SI_ALB_TIR_016]WNS82222.1 hypothetical protein RRU94_15905 [Domibacillus sp. DTU_2020_1001157_1_SI_ALB_TIR_016]